MRKNIVVIFAIITLILSLSGCKGSDSDHPALPTWTEPQIISESMNDTTTTDNLKESSSPTSESIISTEPGEVVDVNPVSLYASIEDVKSWCRPGIKEEYRENIVDEFTKEWIAELKEGGTVTITETDGLYFQTAYQIAFADPTAMSNKVISFLQLWLGRNLTSDEASCILDTIKNASASDNTVMVKNIFPEQIMIYIACSADYGCRITF